MEICFMADSCNTGLRWKFWYRTFTRELPWKQCLQGVKGRVMEGRRSSARMKSQQRPQPITQGAQELGEPFRVALNWSKSTEFLYPTTAIFRYGLPPRRGNLIGISTFLRATSIDKTSWETLAANNHSIWERKTSTWGSTGSCTTNYPGQTIHEKLCGHS